MPREEVSGAEPHQANPAPEPDESAAAFDSQDWAEDGTGQTKDAKEENDWGEGAAVDRRPLHEGPDNEEVLRSPVGMHWLDFVLQSVFRQALFCLRKCLNAAAPGSVNSLTLMLFTKFKDALPSGDVRAMRNQAPAKEFRIGLPPVWLTLCCGLALLVPGNALGGEKFRITPSTNQMSLPQDLGKELQGPASDFLHSRISEGESSQGPILPMPNQPSMIRNPMLEEWQDRKKNWMFDTPNTLDRNKELHAIFGVRDPEASSLEKKPKTVMERYWDAGKEKKDPQNRTDSQVGRDPLNRRPEADAITGRYDPATGKYLSGDQAQQKDSLGIIPALNPVFLFNSDIGPEGLNSPVDAIGGRSILPPNVRDPNFGPKPATAARDANPAQRDFERTWDLRKTPLSQLNDPINSQVDATRFAINPINARKAGALPEEGSASKATEVISYGRSVPVTTRPELMSPGRVLPTGPSFVPPAATPAPAPMLQAKPAILEIPRPKF